MVPLSSRFRVSNKIYTPLRMQGIRLLFHWVSLQNRWPKKPLDHRWHHPKIRRITVWGRRLDWYFILRLHISKENLIHYTLQRKINKENKISIVEHQTFDRIDPRRRDRSFRHRLPFASTPPASSPSQWAPPKAGRVSNGVLHRRSPFYRRFGIPVPCASCVLMLGIGDTLDCAEDLLDEGCLAEGRQTKALRSSLDHGRRVSLILETEGKDGVGTKKDGWEEAMKRKKEKSFSKESTHV